jgi:hypothetical protein
MELPETGKWRRVQSRENLSPFEFPLTGNFTGNFATLCRPLSPKPLSFIELAAFQDKRNRELFRP